MYPEIESSIARLQDFSAIDIDRIKLLDSIAKYIKIVVQKDQVPQLNFICTHNSRRSQIAQIWAAALTHRSGLQIKALSGGTEITSFHPNAISAMERAGFQISNPGGTNSQVEVKFDDHASILCYSKLYDAPEIAQQNFAAIMTCGHADENCPYIPGAEIRFALTYDDPKVGDGTPDQERIYDACVNEIGTQLFYLFNKLLNDASSFTPTKA